VDANVCNYTPDLAEIPNMLAPVCLSVRKLIRQVRFLNFFTRDRKRKSP
jgi:hypothetical protein